jgi:hypothetical protein
MTLTLRPRFLLGVLAVCAVGTLFVLARGSGWPLLVGIALTSIAALAARQSLRLEDRGVVYRSLVPTEDFALPWAEVTQVVIDVVKTSTPGSPGLPVARATFVRRDGPPRRATLFSRADGDRVLEVCRARSVDVLDQRAG